MCFPNLSLGTFERKNFAFQHTNGKLAFYLDQMNCTKKQQSLKYETEDLAQSTLQNNTK